METTQLLNQTLEQIAQANACDTNCQRNLKITELKNTFEQAKSMKNNAGENLRNARKNYYTYAFGEKYYTEEEQKILEKTAENHIKKIKETHNTLKKQIKEEEAEKKENDIALHNMHELLNKYNISNEEILDNVDDQERVLETSQRKVYYTNKRLDFVNSIYWYISWIIRILLIYAIYHYMKEKKYFFLIFVIVSYLLILHFS